MSEPNYTPRWHTHLATNDAPECPLYAEPRIVEALDNPRITFDRTRAQIQRALHEALKDEPSFRLTTGAERRADGKAEARTLNRIGE